MAWRLDRRTDLVLNLHLRPSGKPERVRPEIGLYFTDEAPTRFPMLLQLEHDGALDIPRTSAKFVGDGPAHASPWTWTCWPSTPTPTTWAQDVQGWATLPDGTSTWLVHIADWDVNWQAVYRYREPLFLPNGTRITMRWSFDNSVDNVRNPSHPPRRVRTGNRRGGRDGSPLAPGPAPWREGHRRRGRPRIALQEALMRRRHREVPGRLRGPLQPGGGPAGRGPGGRRARRAREGRGDRARGCCRARQPRSGLPGAGQARRGPRRVPGGPPAATGGRSAQPQPGPGPRRRRARRGGQRTSYREAVRLDPEDAGARAELGAALQHEGGATKRSSTSARRLESTRPAERPLQPGAGPGGTGRWAAAADAFRESAPASRKTPTHSTGSA